MEERGAASGLLAGSTAMRNAILLTIASLLATKAAAEEARTLSLAEALQALESQSFVLAEAKSRVAQAQALIGQAATPLLPQVVAAGGYTRNSDEAKLGLKSALEPIFERFTVPVPEGIPDTVYIQPLSAWTVSASARVPLVVPNAWAER